MHKNYLDYIIISGDLPISTDFSFVPKSRKLILITQDLDKILTEKQKKVFNKIIVLKEFNFDTLLKEVQNCLIYPQNTSLISIDETLHPIVAKINEALDIPGFSYESVIPFSDKLISKNRLLGSKVSFPLCISLDYHKSSNEYLKEIEEKFKFPVIIKPRRLAGSLGIFKIDNIQSLKKWLDDYSFQKKDIDGLDKQYIYNDIEFALEEYIDSTHASLYHCDSIISNGQVVFTGVFRYLYPMMRVKEGKPMGSMPLLPTSDGYKKLQELNKLVVESFRKYAPIPDGVIHTEAFFDKFLDKVIFIETQLRHPGGDTKSVYKHSWGLDLEEIYFKLQMGISIDTINDSQPKSYGAWIFIPTVDGTIDRLRLPELKSEIHTIKYNIQSSQKTKLPKAFMMNNYTALKIFISNTDYLKLQEDFEYLKKFTPFTLKKIY